MAPGAGGRLRGASSVQVRRLRTVFGSGRACRNSCDFRQPLRPARCEPSGLPAHDSRRSPPGTPSSPLPPGPGRCSCRIAAIVAATPPHPPYITLSPQTPPFSHIIPYAPPPPVSARTPSRPHPVSARTPSPPASSRAAVSAEGRSDVLSVIFWHGRRWGHRAGVAGPVRRSAGTYGCDNVHQRMCTLSHSYASGGASAFRSGCL